VKIEIEINEKGIYYREIWVDLRNFECYIEGEKNNRKFKNLKEMIYVIDSLHQAYRLNLK